MIQKGINLKNKKILGWLLFDWANSAYSLVIVSTIFPEIFNFESNKLKNFKLLFFTSSEALYTASISFSFLILIILAPILGGIADYSGYKKKYLQFFTYLGSIACFMLYFFDAEHFSIGVIGIILGSIGFQGSMIFYNAYLPELAHKKHQDKLSALGYAFGYIGSSILLISILYAAQNPNLFNLNDSIDVFKYAFIAVGIWWIGWSYFTFKYLPQQLSKKKSLPFYFREGYLTIKSCIQEAKSNTSIRNFLFLFLFLSIAFQSLWIISPLFAIKEVHMKGSELIIVVLIMQFLGVFGALTSAQLSKIKGNKLVLLLNSFLFFLICLLALTVSNKTTFYYLAGIMGFCMGGLQSICRSSYGKIISQYQKNSSFYSIYDLTEKTGMLIGTGISSVFFMYQIHILPLSVHKNNIFIISIAFLIPCILLINKKFIRNI